MSKNIYQIILKSGAYLALMAVFLVYNGFLFPYITSKQVYFNVIIELMGIFWIAYLLKFPEERPKKNWVTIGLFSYFGVALLTCFTGVDFNLSFWGDIERMLGFFHIAHFLVFYLMLITVFKDWASWKYFFLSSIVVAEIVSLYGITGPSPYSTIGNTAYVSGYILFNLYFVILLFLKEGNKRLRWLYLLLLPLLFVQFRIARTSGAHIGLAVSFLVLLSLYGVFSANKKIKTTTLSSLACLVILIVVFFSNQAKITQLLALPMISTQKVTFQTRLISWEGAFADFHNHPLLGTGFGNYAITFDKYFKPTFYNYTRSETYFDRAHNNLIEIMSTTGLLGVAAYLSIFLAAGLYLSRSYRSKLISLNDFAVISALIVGYFIQNLAVFDSLVTFTALMMTLAYIYYLRESNAPSIVSDGVQVDDKKAAIITNENEYTALAIIAFILLIFIYQTNIKIALMLKGTIDGQISFSQGDVLKAYNDYKKALSYDTGLDRDSRDTYVREIAGRIETIKTLKTLKKEDADNIVGYAIELERKNVAYNDKDSLMQMQLAQVLSAAARYYSADSSKALTYFKESNQAIDQSIKSSPGRITVYFTKAQILLSAGQTDEAIKVLKFATTLNEKYYDSYCYLGNVQLITSKEKEGYASLDKCLNLGGQDLLQPSAFVANLITHYQKQKDNQKVTVLLARLSVLEPKNASVFAELAKYYALAGDIEKAKEAATQAATIDPGLKASADDFVKKLK
ncbi:MAG: O-antigen ligase family protein [Candidatus Falkowbacteria bacterium]|nr:O-antigen ligase family protein [Candidatus Falkowbacteria bacterium]